MLSPREREKRDSRGDERQKQRRKRKMNESEETEETRISMKPMDAPRTCNSRNRKHYPR